MMLIRPRFRMGVLVGVNLIIWLASHVYNEWEAIIHITMDMKCSFLSKWLRIFVACMKYITFLIMIYLISVEMSGYVILYTFVLHSLITCCRHVSLFCSVLGNGVVHIHSLIVAIEWLNISCTALVSGNFTLLFCKLAAITRFDMMFPYGI